MLRELADLVLAPGSTFTLHVISHSLSLLIQARQVPLVTAGQPRPFWGHRPGTIPPICVHDARSRLRLVYVEALPGAKIDGCAFFLDGIPVIGLSGRGKRMDKILFALLHEIAHLLREHVKPDGAKIIVEEVEQHASENSCEEAANQLAESWILPQPLPPARERINQAWVTRIAKERGLAPIVVVGQLQNSGRLD
jgi:hypothetical protein